MRTAQPSIIDNNNMPAENTLNEDSIGWLKTLGAIGFLFFLIKGLLWLILPFLLAQYGIQF